MKNSAISPVALLRGFALLCCLLPVACRRDAVAAADAAPAATPPPVITAPGDAMALPADGLAVLSAGQSVALDTQTRLSFDRVTADSRCPANAQCAWAGEVAIALRLDRAGEQAELQLSTGSRTRASALGWQVEFADYGDCPGGEGECSSLRIVPVSASP